MPGKHVRFADYTDYALSPLPLTPSATYSLQSATSSAGVITPPGIHHSIPLPHIPCQVHALLAYPASGYTVSPALLHDLTRPAATARTAHDQYGLPPYILTQPATVPPLPHLTIICANLPGWSMTVDASQPHLGVTVQDLLHELHHCMRKGVNETEYRALSPQAQELVSRAFRHRYKAAGDDVACEKERSKGLKRVDFLMERTRWMGLSQDKRGPDILVLNVA